MAKLKTRITKIESKRAGKIKPLDSITSAMTSAIQNRHANSPIKVAKLGDAFYYYFTQEKDPQYATVEQWQETLAEQLRSALNFEAIYPGDVDSLGWMSVIAINSTDVFTTSLIRESLDGLCKLETFITPKHLMKDRMDL